MPLIFHPAKQGDVLSAVVQFQPKVIGLIDGTFMQTLSVWHKEILYALDRGVTVLGASSMGALRAAETADFGVIGVGKIFEAYRNGTVNDDDEVVLIHGPQEEGYLPLSLPLINLRFTFEKAQREKKISKIDAESFFAIAQELYYPERSFENLEKRARERGLSEKLIRHVIEYLQDNYVDQKKEDACELLQEIKKLPSSEPVRMGKFDRTTLFDALYQADRRTFYDSVELTQKQIAHYFALHDPRYMEMQFNAMNQALVSSLANICNIELSTDEIQQEITRFRRRHLLVDDEMWTSWLSRNHLNEEEFYEIAEEKARARRLQRCYLSGQFPWRQAKFLLRELKWTDRYEECLEKVATQEGVLNQVARYFNETDRTEAYDRKLIEAHMQATGWNPDTTLKQWAEEAGFDDLLQLVTEIHRIKLAREHLDNWAKESGLEELLQQSFDTADQ